MPRHWEQRDKKLDKRRKVSFVEGGKSVFVIQDTQRKRDRKKVAEMKRRERSEG